MGSDTCVCVFLWSPGPCPHAEGAEGLEVYGDALERVNAVTYVCVHVSTNTHCVFACLRLPVHMKARGVHSVSTPVCVRAHVWPPGSSPMGGVQFASEHTCVCRGRAKQGICISGQDYMLWKP